MSDTTVLLIESRSLTRQCLSQWIEQSFEASRICTVLAETSVDKAILSAAGPIDLILWSIGSAACDAPPILPELERLRARFAEVPIVLLADREHVGEMAAAMRIGVRGYLPTSLDRQEALEVLRFVRAGGVFVPVSAVLNQTVSASMQKPSRRLRSPESFKGLTRRELEVVARLREGKPNKAIAQELDISESTVKVFVHRILTKLNAVNRTEVAFLAQQLEEGIDGKRQDVPALQ